MKAPAGAGMRGLPLLHSRAGRILLILFVIRLSLVALTIAEPHGALFTDSLEYLALSKSIQIRGEYVTADNPTTDLVRTPGYPLFLAALLPARPEAYWPVSLAQLALTGIAGLALFHSLYRRGFERAGTVSALLVLLSPNIALWSLTILSETFFTFLIVAAFVVSLDYVLSGRVSHWILASLLLGWAAYVRPIGLGLLIIWQLFLFFVILRRKSSRTRWGLITASAGMAMLMIVPWVIRNAHAHGEATFSSVGGKTLRGFNFAVILAGVEGTTRNDAVAHLAEVGDTSDQLLWLLQHYPVPLIKGQVVGVARAALGLDIGTWSQVAGGERDQGFGIFNTILKEKPLEALRALARIPFETDFGWIPLIMLLAVVHTGLLMGLALIGVICQRGMTPPWRAFFWLAFLTAAYLILVPGAAGQARFRVPAEPFLAFLAGARWMGSQREEQQVDLIKGNA